MRRTTSHRRQSRLPDNAVLLVIDVQKGFDEPVWGGRNNESAEGNIAKLIRAWRRTNRPVFYVKHMSRLPASPMRPGQEGNGIKEVVRPRPGEPVIEKDVNSAFIGTDLEARLRGNGFDTIVLTGLTTDHCVSTTARMGGNLGFSCYVVSDATATFDRVGPDGKRYLASEMHETALASLHGEFATVVDSATLLERL